MADDLSHGDAADWMKSRGPLPAWLGTSISSDARPGGFTVFLTGLPGAGKSTLARGLERRLRDGRRDGVVVLDGDVVRRHLSADLGWSRSDRDTHVQRVALLAAEICRRGGVAICALIAPYDDARRAARREVERHHRFVLVHVATPLDACERRDPKGLYARARAGNLPGFTGVSDPYEPPADADIGLDLSRTSPEAATGLLTARLRDLGLT